MDLGFIRFEELRVFQLAEELGDLVWETVIYWDYFAKETVGKQLVKAADSIGANIAEGAGRGTIKENQRFVRISRGFLNETEFWLRRVLKRYLIQKDQLERLQKIMNELAPSLNAYLNAIG